MIAYLWVFVGGGMGSIARFGLAELVDKNTSGFPLATFWANMISCFILGYLIGNNLKSEFSQEYKLLLMTGFCGGFSTFSTFSAENYQLLQEGQYSLAITYVLMCFFMGIGLICFGILLSSK